MTRIFQRSWHKWLHICLATSVITALVTGFLTFGTFAFSGFNLREAMFIIHRIAGIIGGLLALFWAATRFASVNRQAKALGTFWWIKIAHAAIIAMIVIIVLFAWIGRSLDGRWSELYSLLPVYNLVSRPNVPWAHFLLHNHNQLAHLLLVLAIGHAIFGIMHIIEEWRYPAASPPHP